MRKKAAPSTNPRTSFAPALNGSARSMRRTKASGETRATRVVGSIRPPAATTTITSSG